MSADLRVGTRVFDRRRWCPSWCIPSALFGVFGIHLLFHRNSTDNHTGKKNGNYDRLGVIRLSIVRSSLGLCRLVAVDDFASQGQTDRVR